MPSVHFIGIGGAGMSGLAEILLERGISVSGSDLSESEKTKELRKLGAKIFIGHKAENILRRYRSCRLYIGNKILKEFRA